MLVVCCPHCGWWGFAHADELGPADARRALLSHLQSSHPLVLPRPVPRLSMEPPREPAVG